MLEKVATPLGRFGTNSTTARFLCSENLMKTIRQHGWRNNLGTVFASSQPVPTLGFEGSLQPAGTGTCACCKYRIPVCETWSSFLQLEHYMIDAPLRTEGKSVLNNYLLLWYDTPLSSVLTISSWVFSVEHIGLAPNVWYCPLFVLPYCPWDWELGLPVGTEPSTLLPTVALLAEQLQSLELFCYGCHQCNWMRVL